MVQMLGMMFINSYENLNANLVLFFFRDKPDLFQARSSVAQFNLGCGVYFFHLQFFNN